MEDRTKVELMKRLDVLVLKQKMATSGLLSREEMTVRLKNDIDGK